MKIYVDEMLKDVSKWLRLGGVKTIYLKGLKDEEIIEIVRKEDCVLITSDKELSKRVGEKSIFVEIKSSLEEKLSTVFRDKRVKKFDCFICTKCGEELTRIEKEEVKGKVYEKVYKNNKEFYFCKNCLKYYWKGRHWKNIEKLLNKILNFQN